MEGGMEGGLAQLGERGERQRQRRKGHTLGKLIRKGANNQSKQNFNKVHPHMC